MEGLEVQIVELQGDHRKLREQSKLVRERWKVEKASVQQVTIVLMVTIVVLVRFNLMVYA